MDILHHAAIGAMGAVATAAAGQPLAGLAFLIGSILPDFDILYGLRGKENYLRKHQGMTHSAIFTIFSGILFGLGAATTSGLHAGIAAACGIMAGMIFHVFLDMTNTLGPRVNWPKEERFNLDAAFFVDLPSWLLTLSGLALTVSSWSVWPFLGYLFIMLAQLLWRANLNWNIRARTGYPIAIPDPFLPWKFSLTRPNPDGSVDLASWCAGHIIEEPGVPAPAADDLRIAETSSAVAFMRDFGRHIAIVSSYDDAEGRHITLRDVAMRRIGRSFGEIRLTETPEGYLLERTNV